MTKDKNPIIGIYQITCIPTGKIYIGSAVNIQRRWRQHKHDLRHSKHGNEYLQYAWNKYGEDQFRFDILEILENTDSIYEVEQKWVDSKNVLDKSIGFNICKKCGLGSRLGMCNPPESVERQRQKLIGRRIPRERVERVAAANRGKKRSPEIREKMRLSRARTGKIIPSEEFVAKISKPVVALNEKAEIVLRFPSLAEARRSGYNSNLTGHMKKGYLIGGYAWCYESELENFDYNKFLANREGKKSTIKKTYLDVETGIYYESQRELAQALGLKTPTLNLQLKSGKHNNRYIEV